MEGWQFLNFPLSVASAFHFPFYNSLDQLSPPTVREDQIAFTVWPFMVLCPGTSGVSDSPSGYLFNDCQDRGACGHTET